MRWLLAGLLITLSAAAGSHTAELPGYAVHAAFALAIGSDQLNGRLEELEDERITPDVRNAMRQTWGPDPCANEPPPSLNALCESARRRPIRPAVLRLLSEDGRSISSQTAERPTADLQILRLYDSPRRTYSFTVDLSVEAGSYAGPYTRLAEPTRNGFGWLVATDTVGAHPDTITLVTTLKSGWKIVPRADGRGKDLLMVRCRPDVRQRNQTLADTGAVPFTLIFDRFSFEQGHWVRRSRVQPGCWENDDAASFPARSLFP